MSALEGTVTLVTGGTSGIGRATVEHLRDRGARVAYCGRGEDEADGLHQGDDLFFCRADVGEEDDVEALVARTVERFGGIDFLFNNAGYEGASAPLGEYPVEAFDEVIRTNLRGAFLVLQQTLPHLLEGRGVAVNVASFVGTVVPVPFAGAYGASKAGVLSLTTTTAAAYGEAGLRVFTVAPWVTDTPMVTERVSGGDAEVLRQMIAMNPSGDMVAPADVAEVVVGLFEDSTGHPNGSAVLVDAGGRTAPMAFPIPASAV